MLDYQQFIDRHYESGSRLREILILHSRSVADKAMAIAREKAPELDLEQVEAAAMLHDIGIFLTDAPGICCYGTEPYLRHGVLGAALLRAEGAPEWAARVAERHTGAGITAADIREHGLPLPADADLMPRTTLEEVVCFADKFFSKSGDMKEKPLERVRASIAKFGAESAARFERLLAKYG